jgi:hypothetical protein
MITRVQNVSAENQKKLSFQLSKRASDVGNLPPGGFHKFLQSRENGRFVLVRMKPLRAASVVEG